MTQLLDEGAPMCGADSLKKNRPAILLSPGGGIEQTRIENIIFAESTAIGLRRTMVDRRLDRDFENVSTPGRCA